MGVCKELEALPVNLKEKMIMDRNEYDWLFRLVLEEGMDSGVFNIQNVTVTTYLIIGALNWAPYWYKESGTMSKAEISLLVRNNLIRMVCVDKLNDWQEYKKLTSK